MLHSIRFLLWHEYLIPTHCVPLEFGPTSVTKYIRIQYVYVHCTHAEQLCIMNINVLIRTYAHNIHVHLWTLKLKYLLWAWSWPRSLVIQCVCDHGNNQYTVTDRQTNAKSQSTCNYSHHTACTWLVKLYTQVEIHVHIIVGSFGNCTMSKIHGGVR